jgi:predicted phosphodiesterase
MTKERTMRVVVLSDIHANLAALNAVLEEVGAFDVLWCLGDIVGYGPEPNECVARLSALPHVAVLGNHDGAALGLVDVEDFNEDARQACLWTSAQLTPVARAYLEALPTTHQEGAYTLVHGSPRAPLHEYLLHPSLAEASFAQMQTSLCLVGHTHVPVIFRQVRAANAVQTLLAPEGEAVQLDEERYIINPGGVGQPRDGDPRAAYLILDSEERVFMQGRVAYDVAQTQAKMRAAGLPPRLSARLSHGW